MIGAEIIGDHGSELMTTARTVALGHHERWDGGGYPDGLAGEAIPEVTRIVALADVFDALLSVRPYKKAWTLEAALDHVRTESGRHFEPRLVEAFFRVLPDCLAMRDKYKDNDD